MNKLPPKLKDPGSFSIPCTIRNHCVGKTLCDLGANINLMPMSIFNKLGIRKAGPTIVMLQLADRSFAHLEGKIEDVLNVKLIKRYQLFLVLATGKIVIDLQKCELTMRVNDQQITFNVFDAMKCVDIDEDCHAIGIIDTVVKEELARFCCNNFDNEVVSVEFNEEEMIEELSELIEAKQLENGARRSFESLNLSERSFKPPRPSVEDRPTLELKPFPLHLKYAYLGGNNTSPVVISAELTSDQEAQLHWGGQSRISRELA
ncbi:Retrovirus-related Pol polyprotein from transposon opus [Gossypium australe]|uniref:Retrovirus-related Pol polyprotein from transposon opus n=1 Tax=Gossypium australe TaxID=47621 RepID=A0A5B6WI37_9ROSI|nr:Retrovirus-related Pol polyprotein from transposon opus [Gossypium australe]